MPAILRWFLQLGVTNPICVRLVQGASRRVRHNYIRSGYLAVLIVVLLFMLIRLGDQSLVFKQLAIRGAEAFQSVAYLQIALICILAPVFMAGAIAQESNPKTWDILLTTPMSALQLVLGNLFGRLFFILALLFASLPLFAITQYFGGVPGRSIFLSYAVASCAALLVGAIAVTLAVNRLAGRRAFFAFYVAVVTYIALTMAIDYFIRSVPGRNGVTVMTALNPFLAQLALLNPTGYPVPEATELQRMSGLARLWFGRPVLAWCLLSGGLSFFLVLTSTTTVRSIGSRTGVPWYRRIFGLGARGSRSRPGRSVWNNPIAWREAAARQATLPKIVARWGFVAAGALWAFGLLLYYHNGAMTNASFQLALLATVWTEMIVILLIAVNVSATAVSREREDGTLDLILTTPITPKDYLNGKLRGLVSYLLPMIAVPVGTLVLASIYVAAGGFGRAGGVTQLAAVGTAQIPLPVVLPEAGLTTVVCAIPFMAFCVMVGLQWSLKSKGTIGSVVATVAIIGLVGGTIGLCGWKAGGELPVVGPVLTALNPVTLVYGNIHPGVAMEETVSDQGVATARASLATGAVVSMIVYVGVILALRAGMVRNFDMTVRRLAGTR